MRFIVDKAPIRVVDGFLEYRAQGDGNCLYHSLCFLFHQHGFGERDPSRLRTTAVGYMGPRVRGEVWDAQPWAFDSTFYRDAPTYLARMGTNGVYADFNCIRAVARRLRVLIVVHVPFGDPVIAAPINAPLHTFNLIYRGNNHYNPLVPQDSDLPAAIAARPQPPKKKPQQRGRKQLIYVQVVRSNEKNEVSCPCEVTGMDATPVVIPIFNERGERTRGTELSVRYCVFRHLVHDPLRPWVAAQPFFFVEPSSDVTRKKRDTVMRQLLENPYSGVRLDWYSGSFGKKGRFIGCHTDYFHKLLRFEEQCYYAQRALFGSNVAGCAGRIEALRAPIGAEATLVSGAVVQVHDGWGFIKQCLAAELAKTRIGALVKVKRPKSNFGMFQWLRAEDELDLEAEKRVVAELAGALEEKLEQQREKPAGKLEEPWAKELVSEDPAMARHPLFVEMAMKGAGRRGVRRITSGDPPLEGGIAMPVPGDALVLPSASERLKGYAPTRVGVFRNPGDNLNWVCTENIDTKSPLATFIGQMEAVQYTLTGQENDGLGFYKGMLGVIPDAEWPKEWKDVCLVVCNADRKASEVWETEEDVKNAKKSKSANRFSMNGCLVVTQWFEAGSCFGVPYEAIQEKLAGDYDGDEAVLLSGDVFPETYAYIQTMVARQEKKAEKKSEGGSSEKPSSGARNPKIEKTFTPLGRGDSRAKCIHKIHKGSELTGKWSNLAAALLCIAPEPLEELARVLEYESAEALLRRASVGIKQGTDAFKTSVDVVESGEEADRILEALDERGFTVPHTRMKNDDTLFRDEAHVPPVLGDEDGPPETEWARTFAVQRWMTGIPSALMRRLVPAIEIPDPLPTNALETYQRYVTPPTEEEEALVAEIGEAYKSLLIRYRPGERGLQKDWDLKLSELRTHVEVKRLAELVWWALHDPANLPTGWPAWRLPDGVFKGFHEEAQRIVKERPKGEEPEAPSSGEVRLLVVEDDEQDSSVEPDLVDKDFFNDFGDDFDDDDLN